MSYVWQKWLADALRAEGCKVLEYDGWKSRGRPSSSGSFDPYALLLHHTGTKTSATNPAPTLSTCVHGRSDLPGPLCQVLIGYDGTCHVIAAGRANHAGECNGNGPTSQGDGNAQMIGFELDYSGSQAVSDAQADATARASTAVLRHLQKDESYCRGHKETSSTGKWDPGRHGSSDPAYDMNEVRQRIRTRLAGGGDDEVPAYASIESNLDQSIGAGATEVVAFQEEKSDTHNIHNEDSWEAAFRPPEGYRRGQLWLRFRAVNGQPGARLVVMVATRHVDSDSDSAVGHQDAYLGDDGHGRVVATYMGTVDSDTRYRWQVQNLGSSPVVIEAGTAYRCLLYQG